MVNGHSRFYLGGWTGSAGGGGFLFSSQMKANINKAFFVSPSQTPSHHQKDTR